MQEIYFDNAATTQVLPEIADIAVRMMCEDYGNPSAMYGRGLQAERAVKEAREQVAALIGAQPQDIIFTSGATEANNMALRGGMKARARRGKHMVVSALEHQSVIQTVRAMLELGYDFDLGPVDTNGRLNPTVLQNMMRSDTIMASIMLVNNEVGTIQQIPELRRAIDAKRSQVLLHVDASQALGKMPIDVGELGVDLLTASGHKLHAPKGVGFIYVRPGLRIPPFINGGGQEAGWRSGTENTPGICALGLAAKLAREQMGTRLEQVKQVRAVFLQGLKDLSGWRVNGEGADLLPHILSVAFDGVKSEVLLHMLEEKGLLVAAGAACSSRKDTLSHVLRAMRMRRNLIEGTVRFSFSHLNTVDEAERASQLVCQAVQDLRGII